MSYTQGSKKVYSQGEVLADKKDMMVGIDKGIFQGLNKDPKS